MTLPVRDIRLLGKAGKYLDRLSSPSGTIYYDTTNQTLRLYANDAEKYVIATREWTDSEKAPINNPTFTGTVSGVTATMVGLGNVTNESKTTMFNDPTFTGTVSGVSATMVGLGNVTNESKTTMFSSPAFTGTASAENVSVSGTTAITNTTASTNSTSGALTVAGGVGIAKGLNVDGTIIGNQVVSIKSDAEGLNDAKVQFINGSTSSLLSAIEAIGPSYVRVTSSGGSQMLLIDDSDVTVGNDLNVNGTAYISGNANVTGDIVITGNMTVNGDTTVVNTTTLAVEDKNIELGTVETPSDFTADGGGITLKGTTDKTIVYDQARESWASNINFEIDSSVLKVNNSSTLTVSGNEVSTTNTEELLLSSTAGVVRADGTMLVGSQAGLQSVINQNTQADVSETFNVATFDELTLFDPLTATSSVAVLAYGPGSTPNNGFGSNITLVSSQFDYFSYSTSIALTGPWQTTSGVTTSPVLFGTGSGTTGGFSSASFGGFYSTRYVSFTVASPSRYISSDPVDLTNVTSMSYYDIYGSGTNGGTSQISSTSAITVRLSLDGVAWTEITSQSSVGINTVWTRKEVAIPEAFRTTNVRIRFFQLLPTVTTACAAGLTEIEFITYSAGTPNTLSYYLALRYPGQTDTLDTARIATPELDLSDARSITFQYVTGSNLNGGEPPPDPSLALEYSYNGTDWLVYSTYPNSPVWETVTIEVIGSVLDASTIYLRLVNNVSALGSGDNIGVREFYIYRYAGIHRLPGKVIADSFLGLSILTLPTLSAGTGLGWESGGDYNGTSPSTLALSTTTQAAVDAVPTLAWGYGVFDWNATSRTLNNAAGLQNININLLSLEANTSYAIDISFILTTTGTTSHTEQTSLVFSQTPAQLNVVCNRTTIGGTTASSILQTRIIASGTTYTITGALTTAQTVSYQYTGIVQTNASTFSTFLARFGFSAAPAGTSSLIGYKVMLRKLGVGSSGTVSDLIV